MPERGRCFSMGYATCLSQWQWTGRGLWQPQEIQLGKRESRKTNKTLRGTWLGGDQIGTL